MINTKVVPAWTDEQDGTMGLTKAPQPSAKKAPTLRSKNSCKIPGIAYHLALSRANHFSKIALLAFILAVAWSFVKYYIAVKGEEAIIDKALADTAQSLAKSVVSQIEADLSALDGVANLWHLNSKLPRETLRKYVKSKFYKKVLKSMQTVILTVRVQPHHRDAIEMDPASVQLRQDCCNGTVYDKPYEDSYCRARASNQCNISGPHRYYFMERTPNGVKLAARNGDERLIVLYQEPFEDNPGPTGLDLLTLPPGRNAWWESARTGKKAMTKRMERVFSPGAFGMSVWNDLFVDRAVDVNKSVTIDGVSLMSKQDLESQGKEAYAIASVVAVYEVQYMFYNVVQNSFSQSLENTRVWLLDERSITGESERILAMWDSGMTVDETNTEVMNKQDKTKAQLCADHDKHKLFKFNLPELSEGTDLSVLVLPKENFSAGESSEYPLLILGLSLALATFAQMERWIGHPIVISSSRLWQAKVEQKLREELEPEIVRHAVEKVIEVNCQHAGAVYSDSHMAA